MKKVLSFVLFLVISLSSVFMLACAKESDKVKVMVPNGITLIAWGGLYDNRDVEIDNVNGPDLLSTAFASSSHDIIVAPLNLGAKLYNNSNTKYKLDSMITFGNLFIVSKDKVSLDDKLQDLKGKKLIAFGRNATPDIILQAALNSKDITDCEIEYQSGVSEVVALFKGEDSEYDYALVAEPVLSQLKNMGLDLNIVDLQEVLQYDSDMESIPQAGVFINPESKRIDKINEALQELKNNIEYLKANPQDYAQDIIKHHEYFKNITSEVIASAIQSGDIIDYKKAKDNKPVLEAYFQLLIDQNKNLLGAQPSDDFYYY
ncbi:MAG TPA: ABC transporter substrate-binding protein [Clostridiales bacterium]|nr:ABC transporter substrate-binding protein [Clostridiales bacterium]